VRKKSVNGYRRAVNPLQTGRTRNEPKYRNDGFDKVRGRRHTTQVKVKKFLIRPCRTYVRSISDQSVYIGVCNHIMLSRTGTIAMMGIALLVACFFCE